METPGEERGSPLLVVTHSDFLDLLLKALFSVSDTSKKFVFKVDNCSLTEVFLPVVFCQEGKEVPVLNYLNRNHHTK